MWKRVVLGIAALFVLVVVVFLVMVALQPSDFRITRSATMEASPEEVFAQVNNFHNWQAWSPWAKLDPDAKATFEGPTSGEGAIFRWAGNEDVGEGDMTITESEPNELIRLKLHFIKPFEDTADTEFTFAPVGDQTTITWTMSGKNNFVGRIFCMFMNMDEMVGSQFDEGLANIRAIVETPPAEADEATGETQQDAKT